MPQFNETELTAAVIRSFEDTPNPRAKFLLQELVKSRLCLRCLSLLKTWRSCWRPLNLPSAVRRLNRRAFSLKYMAPSLPPPFAISR